MQLVLGRSRVFCRVALTSAGKYAAGGERRCRAMGTGQFSPLSPPRRSGRQRSSRSGDGKGRGVASLAPPCHRGTSTCPPASIPGAWRWPRARRRPRCHTKGGWQRWLSALSPPRCPREDAAGSKAPHPARHRATARHGHRDGVPRHSPSRALLGGQGTPPAPSAQNSPSSCL